MLERLQRTIHRARHGHFRADYKGDGLAVRKKNLGFLDEPRFAAAWSFATAHRKHKIQDIRWRAHVACWAAANGLRLAGDFVECGVNTGLLSMTVCHYLGFQNLDRRFWLFDTYAGLPVDRAPPEERAAAEKFNGRYRDVYEIAKRNFAPFPNAHLVRGVLPDTLANVDIERIAYLSIDLNSAWAEKAVIEALWDRLNPGTMVVLDDYAWRSHAAQYAMWNAFAADRGRTILSLPTGQGILSK